MSEESLSQRVGRRAPTLAEGSIYELLRRDSRVEFDPLIAHAALIYGGETRQILGDIHLAYSDIAERHHLPLLALTDTWRASASRVASSRFAARTVNADNVAFLRDLLRGRSAWVAGLSGPAGDAYRPEEAPSRQEALRYHSAQIDDLARAGVDLLFAATLPDSVEAGAIGALMAATGLPWMLSFVVRADGTLLDGTPLADSIRAVDDEAVAPAIGYSINCVHSSTAVSALSSLPDDVARRIVAFQGNASRLSPEELDGREEIDSEPPVDYAEGSISLVKRLAVPIAGGCCGTSPDHLEELAARLASDT